MVIYAIINPTGAINNVVMDILRRFRSLYPIGCGGSTPLARSFLSIRT